MHFNFLIVLGLIISGLSHAAGAPQFSAFAFGRSLHVTVLADNCNTLHPDFKVHSCTKNLVDESLPLKCEASFNYSMSKVNCEKDFGVPRVMTVDLDKTKLPNENIELGLTLDEQTIAVKVDKLIVTKNPKEEE